MDDVMRESMETVLIVLAALVVVFNVVATVVALRSETATRTQRVLQSCLVWLFPLLGAFVVILFHRLDRRNQGPAGETMRLDGSEIDVGLAARHDGHH
jgi:cytochrome bd-type quinol oxidase subunit 2